MESTESQVRMPSVLMPSYNKLISTEEGKLAVKRIRVGCGVCKLTRFYSIHRGITRIGGVVACEGCRQFFQRYKKQPWMVSCSKRGKCYQRNETPRNKCKACWVAHMISRCPVPVGLFNHLITYLPTDVKNKMPPNPPRNDEVMDSERGCLGLEVLRGEEWVDATDKDLEPFTRGDDMNDSDDMIDQDAYMEFEAEEAEVDDPDAPEPETEPEAERNNTRDTGYQISTRRRSTRSEELSDGDERGSAAPRRGRNDVVMATLLEGLVLNQQNKFMENFNPTRSERVRRKKNKVQYFNNTTRSKAQNQSSVHGADGAIVSSGKDLCDCLQPDCPGCHFPCPRCKSLKCGSECRVNRKWYYEKVEVQGTKLAWRNTFVKKN